MISGPNSIVSGEDGRPVMDGVPRSSFLPSGYDVDMTGSCPAGRGIIVPTTRTPCRNVSLSAQVIHDARAAWKKINSKKILFSHCDNL